MVYKLQPKAFSIINAIKFQKYVNLCTKSQLNLDHKEFTRMNNFTANFDGSNYQELDRYALEAQ